MRGVAGSGKSLALINRVEKIILEMNYDSILVLYYNRFMSDWLNSKRHERWLKVECKTFHSWSYSKLGYSYKDDSNKDSREKVIGLAKNSKLKYQAILIDEAQDFYDEWFQALLEVLDPQTNSLLFVYDNTQSINGQAHRRKSDWTWKNLGIEVASRSQIFDLNYRNSPEIVELAWKFIKPALDKAGMKVGREKIGEIVEPKKKLSRNSGILPSLLQINRQEMPVEIAKQVKTALNTFPKSSIGILTHPSSTTSLRAAISRELGRLGIKHHAPKNSQQRGGNVVDTYVIVDSWNALKGVEFDAVIIAGVDLATEESDNNRDFEEKAGLYVAMTRSREHLIMLYENKTPTIEMIEECLKSPDQLSSES